MVDLPFRAFFSVLRFLGLFALSDGLEDEVDKDSEELDDGHQVATFTIFHMRF
jgi:hypothetical protein